ncbi:MAG: hypothetical protein ABSE18_00725 [Minisyncoccia bacterium]|jgi:hypothetical protein
MNIKKLITSFLILAALAASSALLLSNENWFSSSRSPAAQVSLGNDESAPPIASNNAFLPTTPQGAGITQDENDDSAAVDDPNNLTGVVVNSFMNNILASNPSGPQQNANGDDTLTFNPNEDQMTGALAQSATLQHLYIPNWDLDALEQKLNIATTSSPDDIANYSDALNGIFNKNFVSSGVLTIANGDNADIGSAPLMASSTDAALAATAQLRTPANLVDFQKSLVKVLVYQKNALALIEGTSGDPVRASLIFQAQEPRYNAALQDFENELQKAQSSGTFSFGNVPARSGTGWSAAVLGLIGIRTAYAQWPTFDFSVFANQIEQFIKTILLQIVKNSLISFIQHKIVSWISNPKNPKFIQQWGGELSNAFVAAANSTLSQISPNLSPSFGPLVGSALKPQKSAVSGIQSTLDNDLANLGTNQQNFYNNFSQGGFDAYFDLFKPDNNFFTAFMDTQDAMLAAGGKSAQTAQTKAVAGQASRGNQLCSDGSNPYATHMGCDEGSLATTTYGNECMSIGGTPLGPPDKVNNGGLCANGDDPTVTSPDQVTKAIQSAGLKSPIDLIVNGDDVTGLVIAMTESVLTNLVNQGLNAVETGLSGAQNPSPATVAADNAAVNGTVASSTPPAQPVTCMPKSQSATIALGSSNQAYVTFEVTGGVMTATSTNPTYTWTANWPVGGAWGVWGSTGTGTGSTFSVTFTANTAGTYNYTATVTASPGGSDFCQVQITAY